MRVLEQTKWRIEGPKGAALILGLHPSTVRSRMLKLGIRKENGTRTRQVSNQKSKNKMSKTKRLLPLSMTMNLFVAAFCRLDIFRESGGRT